MRLGEGDDKGGKNVLQDVFEEFGGASKKGVVIFLLITLGVVLLATNGVVAQNFTTLITDFFENCKNIAGF